MTRAAPDPEFSYIVATAELKKNGRTFLISPNEKARTLIASRLRIPAVNALSGAFCLTPIKDGIRVAGQLSANLERTCVATLEPVAEIVEEEFAIDFIANFSNTNEADIELGALAAEPFESVDLDLGEILVQQLVLAMEIYPRNQEAASLADKYRTASESPRSSVLRGPDRPPNEKN